MFGQVPLDILLMFMLYAAGATVSAIACIYLLLRRGNAFAPDIVTPVPIEMSSVVREPSERFIPIVSG